MPGEEADDDLLAEPDLTDQEERDEYMQSKISRSSKKKKDRLHSRTETEEGMGDEHAIAGFVGPLGASGNGPGKKPYSKQRKMRSRNAMGSKRPIDEYDE